MNGDALLILGGKYTRCQRFLTAISVVMLNLRPCLAPGVGFIREKLWPANESRFGQQHKHRLCFRSLRPLFLLRVQSSPGLASRAYFRSTLVTHSSTTARQPTICARALPAPPPSTAREPPPLHEHTSSATACNHGSRYRLHPTQQEAPSLV